MGVGRSRRRGRRAGVRVWSCRSPWLNVLAGAFELSPDGMSWPSRMLRDPSRRPASARPAARERSPGCLISAVRRTVDHGMWRVIAADWLLTGGSRSAPGSIVTRLRLPAAAACPVLRRYFPRCRHQRNRASCVIGTSLHRREACSQQPRGDGRRIQRETGEKQSDARARLVNSPPPALSCRRSPRPCGRPLTRPTPRCGTIRLSRRATWRSPLPCSRRQAGSQRAW